MILVRNLRAILARLPDDAMVMVSLKGTRVAAEKVGFNQNLNQVGLFLNPTDIQVALDNLMTERYEEAIDEL